MNNRAERRRRQRELEKKTKEELNRMKKLCGRNEKTEAVEWALNLKPQEQKHLNLMMTENSKNDVNVYLEAYTMALRINLNDNEELINKINDDVSEEGYKVKEYRDNGGNYIMALKNNKEAVIKDYENGIASNIKESEVIKDLAVNYKATVNAIKLIIKDYKKSKVKECKSNTCPFQKNNKCTNEVVLAGKDECYQFNANDNVKIIKDGTTTKKDKIFKLLDFERVVFEKSINIHKKKNNIKSKWRIVKIGDVCKTASGGTPLSTIEEYYKDGDIPWINSGEIRNGIINSNNKFITQSGLENSSAKIFPVDTVLVAMYGATAGQVGILTYEAATNQAVCGILPSDNVLPKYLYYYLKTQLNSFLLLRNGVARLNISQGIIKDFSIPLPPKDIQRSIIKELEMLDENNNKKLDEINTLKKSFF